MTAASHRRWDIRRHRLIPEVVLWPRRMSAPGLGASNLSRSNSDVSAGEVLLMIHDVGTVGGFDECKIANAPGEPNLVFWVVAKIRERPD